MDKVAVKEYERRLTQLCIKHVSLGMPRKRRDQHIIMVSVTRLFETGRSYTENEVNGIIQTWLEQVGRSMRVDHVTLRRHLVDEGYLKRDPAGNTYQLNPITPRQWVDDDVLSLDPAKIVQAARAENERRRREHSRS